MASNPLLKFREEILEKVIYPKVYGILFDKGNNLTPTQLWKDFREKHECSVSLKEFKEWLSIMKLHQEQVTTWNIDVPVPNDVTHPTQYQDSFLNKPIDKVPEVKVPDDPEINFDNE
tara:strand:- start:587 stop:937 length:351 start_codon:yes stop_codon:yes gene_type:complete